MSTEHLDLILEITRTIEAVESCGGERKALDLLTDDFDNKSNRHTPLAAKMMYEQWCNRVLGAIDPERDKVAMAEEIATMVKHNWVGPVEAITATFMKINRILKGEKE